MKERIIAAAVNREGLTFSVPPPGRHHNIIRAMAGAGIEWGELRDQGFLTDQGRFVDRREACVLAREAGQIIRKTGPVDQLFSEDLW